MGSVASKRSASFSVLHDVQSFVIGHWSLVAREFQMTNDSLT